MAEEKPASTSTPKSLVERADSVVDLLITAVSPHRCRRRRTRRASNRRRDGDKRNSDDYYDGRRAPIPTKPCDGRIDRGIDRPNSVQATLGEDTAEDRDSSCWICRSTLTGTKLMPNSMDGTPPDDATGRMTDRGCPAFTDENRE